MKKDKWEKEMYKFSYECAIKGIDVEKMINNISKICKEMKDISNIIDEQTNKNYNFLLKYKK